MKIGYKVAYMMTGPSGLITHNSERFTTKKFGSLGECREMAGWFADELKDADHIGPVVLQELDDQDDDGQDSISVPLGRERGS
ncbi:hypothetical protein [Deinococcus humi]|uniref:Uncharacterized protein n=1 Tax=Deinococcus humi TaxID=662880 RepID=A0A7W8JUC3_9DEIO|nr:hypothetical protein [Deinococcus humi]MBB5362103.1 hypothetical protein [Deinococcus humi]GGO22057.1 hypothetical protein GCM10008949_08940 [Deinococcus humi]